MDASYFETYGCLGLTQIALGRLDDAVESFREADRLTGSMFPLAQAFLAYALGFAGRADEARAMLTRLYATREQRYVPPTYLAVAEIGLGEIDRAFAALEGAYSAKDGTLLFLRILPVFRPLRSDPRFENLCRRLALPNPAAAALARTDAETQTWGRAQAEMRSGT